MEGWVMHACMNISDNVGLQFADCDVNGRDTGTNICLQLTYDNADDVKNIFNVLKKEGRTICDAQPTFYSPMYAEVVDKFGVRWSIMQENKAE
jgi:PhnB protein